jgi:hypothetical protein
MAGIVTPIVGIHVLKNVRSRWTASKCEPRVFQPKLNAIGWLAITDENRARLIKQITL